MTKKQHALLFASDIKRENIIQSAFSKAVWTKVILMDQLLKTGWKKGDK